MSHASLNRLGLLLIAIAALVAACEFPTPVSLITPATQPTPTALSSPTVPAQPTSTSTATATTLPPTATATTAPPHTPTINPTSTAIPTQTSSVAPRATQTAKPTATKGVPASTAPGVSAKPTTLENSVQQSLSAVYASISLLDQMKQGGGVELCAPLLKDYQNIHNAPAYDPNGQSVQFQQAYNLYRQAIDLVNSRASTFQSCGQGGGAIGGLDWSETRARLDRAAQLLQQARDWAQRTVNPSSSMALPDAVTRARLAVVAILAAMDRALESGSRESCEPLVAEITALKGLPTYQVGDQPAAIQDAYGLYRQAVDLAIAKTASIADVCSRGGGEIGSLDLYTARQSFRDIYSNLSQALQLLGQ